MQKRILAVIILLGSLMLISCNKEESKPLYKTKFLSLQIEGNGFFIRTSEENAFARNAELESLEKEKGVKIFSRMSKNEFIVFDQSVEPKKEDYHSYIYKNREGNIIIILPRIVFKAKESSLANRIIKGLGKKIVVEKTEYEEIILKCLTNRSEEVLKMVNNIEKKEGVIWCEPEMYSSYKLN